MIITKQRNLLWNPKNGNIKGRSAYVGHILPRKSNTKFQCKTITDPMELLKMGYLSTGTIVDMNNYKKLKLIKSSTVPANDYDAYKEVA